MRSGPAPSHLPAWLSSLFSCNFKTRLNFKSLSATVKLPPGEEVRIKALSQILLPFSKDRILPQLLAIQRHLHTSSQLATHSLSFLEGRDAGVGILFRREGVIRPKFRLCERRDRSRRECSPSEEGGGVRVRELPALTRPPHAPPLSKHLLSAARRWWVQGRLAGEPATRMSMCVSEDAAQQNGDHTEAAREPRDAGRKGRETLTLREGSSRGHRRL